VVSRDQSRDRALEAIFRDVRDRVHFVELLGGMSARYGLDVHAYVLMDNSTRPG
jgi:hypothetical protein